jgi:hypothetical protein
MRTEVLLGMMNCAYEDSDRRENVKTVGKKCEVQLDAVWNDPSARLRICPAKEILSELNKYLTEKGLTTISAGDLAAALTPREIASEVSEMLRRVSRLAR